MKKILVPTDFSEFADYAADLAIELGKKGNAEIHFVHLMDIPVDWINLVEPDQKKMYPDITSKVKATNNKLDLLLDKAGKAGLEAKKFIQFNSNYKYLIKHIESFHCDFVVMGSHGTSGIVEWFIGSNTEKVVRNAPVPVMVVKNSTPQLGDIVFASDFEKEALNGFRQVLEFAKTLQVKLHLLFINTPANFTETELIDLKMKRFITEGGNNVTGTWVYNCFDFEEGLSKFTEKHGHIVAMITHGAKGSVTESVINHLSIPVLSLHY
jgi:nucleotide-binding universal stress UspA family protein